MHLAGFETDYKFVGTAQNFTAERSGFKDTIMNIESVVFMEQGLVLSSNALKFFKAPIVETPLLINGNSKNNNLPGNEENNEIYGLAGNDIIDGLGGDDEIHGGLGKDICTGGSGSDTFYFDTRIGKSQFDVITDYNRIDDSIALESAFFRKVGAAVGSSELRFGTKAKDKNDYLVYDQKKGNLYYDADGNGDKGQIFIAQLTNKAKITAADFDII